jgi:predicted phage terminase large subunit-like protein
MTLALTPEQLAYAVKHKDKILRAIDKVNAEDSLYNFVKVMWSILEPNRVMVEGWVMQAICEHLQAVTERKLRKVLINVPPGTSKSVLSTVYWPAWEWGPRNMPHLRYLSACYVQHLSTKHNRYCRHLIESDLYQQMWGDRFKIASDQAGKELFANDHYGFKMALGVGGATIGERGDRFILDDPHNTMEAESEILRDAAVRWYLEAASSRHNDPNDQVEVVIMQRLHENDVAGEIIRNLEAFGYEHLCIEMEFDPNHPVARKRRSRIGWTDPRADRYWAQKAQYDAAQKLIEYAEAQKALDPPGQYDEQVVERAKAVPPPVEGEIAWPERFPMEAIITQKAKWEAQGSQYATAGQFQQWPISRKGGMCDREKAQIIKLHEVPVGNHPSRGWDLAGSRGKKSPWTVGVKGKLVNGKLYILDVVRERVVSDELDELMARTADFDDEMAPTRQNFPQDPAQAGKYQRSHMSRFVLQGHDFTSSTEEKDKEARARPFAAQWNAGNVYLVEGHWNIAYINEICMFPGGQYKDQMDATTRMYGDQLTRVEQDLPGVGRCVVQVPSHKYG